MPWTDDGLKRVADKGGTQTENRGELWQSPMSSNIWTLVDDELRFKDENANSEIHTSILPVKLNALWLLMICKLPQSNGATCEAGPKRAVLAGSKTILAQTIAQIICQKDATQGYWINNIEDSILLPKLYLSRYINVLFNVISTRAYMTVSLLR